MLWIDWFIKIQVCERSLNNTLNGPTIPPGQHFVRADMLPSGYLIRPCEGGGSIIHIVDHVNLEVSNPFSSNSFNYLISHNIWLTEAFFLDQPWSVPEVLRPLYESSTLLAQKTAMAVWCFSLYARFLWAQYLIFVDFYIVFT